MYSSSGTENSNFTEPQPCHYPTAIIISSLSGTNILKDLHKCEAISFEYIDGNQC